MILSLTILRITLNSKHSTKKRRKIKDIEISKTKTQEDENLVFQTGR